jgi:hypothetical protein
MAFKAGFDQDQGANALAQEAAKSRKRRLITSSGSSDTQNAAIAQYILLIK